MMMQTGKMELMSQQVVLAFLGFYKGAIDGIWSTATIQAKQAYERELNFVPGVPSNGLPFTTKGRLPKGLYWDEKKLLGHRQMTPEKAAEIVRSRTRVAPAVPSKVEQPKVDPVIEDEDDAQE